MKKLLLLFALLMLSAGLAHAQGNRELNTLPTPENNQIVYRSSDHQKITPFSASGFGVTYNDDQSTYDTEADYGVITFDGNVATIGTDAFRDCTTLTAIVWPNTVTSIGYRAFKSCASIAEITIPNTVTSIGLGAFAGCTNLSTINLQEGITSIEREAFVGCAGMEELTIPSTVTSIGYCAFSGWQNLTKLTVKADSIGNNAFQNCTNLSSIDLQEGVTSIGGSAFYGCAGMAELTIPSTVTSIGGGAFDGWTTLTKLTVKAGSIGNGAFRNCTNLSSIDLQEGVTGIGNDAFNGCASMTELTIPSTVTSIGNYAFNGCAGMAELTIPSTINTIGEGAFSNWTALNKLIIHTGSIGANAFQNCSNVTSITFLGYVVLDNVSFNTIGTAESPVALKIPSAWLITDKPVNSTPPWHGGYFNCEYTDPVKEFLGSLGTKQNGPAVKVTDKDDNEIILYAPKKVEYIKVKEN